MNRTRSLQVAIYWLSDRSYGGGKSVKDMRMAREIAARNAILGYDKPGVSEIHIIETVLTVRKYEK